MYNKLFLLFFIVSIVTTTVLSQVQTFTVGLSQTDRNYAVQDSHVITRHATIHNNKLFLFFGGSFSNAKDYGLISRVAASIGYDVVSLSYPNDVGVNPLGTTADSLVFDKFRQEICFGTPLSSFVTVDTFNAIYTRTIKLIQYLATTYPTQNWQQYINANNTLNWNKIAVGGHSQGAGHGAYLAKFFPVERNVMFSGPNDYSVFYNKSARWLRQAGVTPSFKQFAFLHLQDETVPFTQQYENVKGLGLLQTVDTIKIDNTTMPYSNARCLYSSLPAAIAGQYHGSTVVAMYTPLNAGNAVFLPVWQYMLTASTTTNINSPTTEKPLFKVFPNPSNGIINIQTLDHQGGTIMLINAVGQVVLTKKIEGTIQQLSIQHLPKGVYFVRFKKSSIPIILE
jgi:Secretion system C-terminal sorting domain